MRFILILLCAVSVAFGAHKPYSPLPAPYTEKCLAGQPSLYPPKGTSPPEFTVSMDDPPETRWAALATKYSEEMKGVIQVIKNLTAPIFHGKLISYLDNHLDKWDAMLPEPYATELKSISEASGVPLGEMVFFNLFFELSSFCTSIVAEDPTGNIFHARNMDLGLFLGWNVKTHQWKLTEALRKDLVNVNIMKDGKLLYKTTTYVGFVGVFTAMKPNAFSMTMNRRMDRKDGGIFSIMQFLKGKYVDFACFAARETFENATTYTEAVQQLSTKPMGCPNYMIMGGTKSGEGSILTRGRSSELSTVHLNVTAGKWYVLQTNYDYWKDTYYFDDRRAPGNLCMTQMGQANVGFPQLFNVLSSKTTVNKVTVYSSLMHTSQSRYETYIQTCEDPCWMV